MSSEAQMTIMPRNRKVQKTMPAKKYARAMRCNTPIERHQSTHRRADFRGNSCGNWLGQGHDECVLHSSASASKGPFHFSVAPRPGLGIKESRRVPSPWLARSFAEVTFARA